ncbi:MAG: carbon-nitrogen family hydrolase [Firmicutes bacterium]|nr:carbon-nitrogen family hydrolase [Bacillota bacterium]
MKLALAQINPKFENKPENMKAAEACVKKAEKGGADLIIFPEMSLTGFSMHPERVGEMREASESLEFFRGLAEEYSMGIIFGMPELDLKGAYNAAFILDKKGAILSSYRKIHPFSYGREAAHYLPGEELCFAEFEGIPLSLFICYDLRFPEIYSAASGRSELLITIANWPAVRGHLIPPLLCARAIENQSFAVFVNITGFDGKQEYPGCSAVFGPDGDRLLLADEREDVFFCDIDIKAARKRRENFPMKRDRRPGLYAALLMAHENDFFAPID